MNEIKNFIKNEPMVWVSIPMLIVTYTVMIILFMDQGFTLIASIIITIGIAIASVVISIAIGLIVDLLGL